MANERITTSISQEPARRQLHPSVGHIVFISAFLLMLVAIPVVQTIHELGSGEGLQVLDVFKRLPTAESLSQYESAVADKSIVAQAVRKRWHWLSLVTLRAGNQKALVARDGNIFYRPSLDFAIAPGFMRAPFEEGHPVPAIIAFRDALRQQGVKLVLLIVPGKESIYPEWLSHRHLLRDGPPANEDMGDFLAEMQRAGIPTIYPAETLWNGKQREAMYLHQDTHWTPAGMALVADELATAIDDDLAEAAAFTTHALSVTRHGDLYDMLGLPEYLPPALPEETVEIEQVLDVNGRPLEPDATSPVVLLGDSFTNIYSASAMGWGDHAGLGEHLSLRLGQPVDVIALNDGGVNTARANLARRPDALIGKQTVVWQFAARDLVVSPGQWQIIDIGE